MVLVAIPFAYCSAGKIVTFAEKLWSFKTFGCITTRSFERSVWNIDVQLYLILTFLSPNHVSSDAVDVSTTTIHYCHGEESEFCFTVIKYISVSPRGLILWQAAFP